MKGLVKAFDVRSGVAVLRQRQASELVDDLRQTQQRLVSGST